MNMVKSRNRMVSEKLAKIYSLIDELTKDDLADLMRELQSRHVRVTEGRKREIMQEQLERVHYTVDAGNS